MTKAEEREVIIETLQQELIEKFDSNIEYYSENIAKKPKKFDKKLDKLDQYLLVDYLQHLIDDRLDHLIKKYFLVVVDGELDFDLIEPIYVEYIKKFVNGKLNTSSMKNRKLRGLFRHNDITVSVEEYNEYNN
jgi:hypothetical protein